MESTYLNSSTNLAQLMSSFKQSHLCSSSSHCNGRSESSDSCSHYSDIESFLTRCVLTHYEG